MRERLSDYQEKYGDLYNLEATPAESTSYRLAKHDVAKYPNIITATKDNDGSPYYTNSSHLPVGFTSDIFEALDMQDELQTLYTSGTVFHAFLGEKLPDWQSTANLVKKIAENYKLPYYTMSPTYSICAEHGYITGEHFTCPICGKQAEVYSRITGYYRPVQNWNDGKLQEFKNRKLYDVKNSKLKHERAAACAVENNDVQKTALEDGYYLFTMKTCPNCPIAREALANKGIAFKELDAYENADLTNEFGIRQAPTLIVINNGEVKKVTSAPNIKKFIEA